MRVEVLRPAETNLGAVEDAETSVLSHFKTFDVGSVRGAEIGDVELVALGFEFAVHAADARKRHGDVHARSLGAPDDFGLPALNLNVPQSLTLRSLIRHRRQRPRTVPDLVADDGGDGFAPRVLREPLTSPPHPSPSLYPNRPRAIQSRRVLRQDPPRI